jgi:uncharacterized protein (DUF58 family)
MGQYTPFPSRKRSPASQSVAYASLDELVRLRAQASGFSFLPRQPVHSVLSGRYASRLRGRGLNFEELKAYLPGDDTRNIDWRVTARTSEPFVRVYTEEKDRPVWLLVDQRITMFFASRGNMKSRVAAEVAAIAAWRALAQGDRCGAIVFNDAGVQVFEPQRSESAVMRILGAIVQQNRELNAGFAGDPAPGMFNEALRRADSAADHDNLVCLVTDGSGINPESRRWVTRLSAHNDVLGALIYDPMEADLPAAGQLDLTDGRVPWRVDCKRENLRKQFRSEFLMRMERMQNVSRKHAIPLMQLRTNEPVIDQIRQQLGRR